MMAVASTLIQGCKIFLLFLLLFLATLQIVLVENHLAATDGLSVVPFSLQEFAEDSLYAMEHLGNLTSYSDWSRIAEVITTAQSITVEDSKNKTQADDGQTISMEITSDPTESNKSRNIVKDSVRLDKLNETKLDAHDAGLLVGMDESKILNKTSTIDHGELYQRLLRDEFLQAELQMKRLKSLTSAEIAERYGIPVTANLECEKPTPLKKLIGLIPSEQTPSKTDKVSEYRRPLIRKLVWFTWKSNYLRKEPCVNVQTWSKMNRDYDVILMGDEAVQRFIKMEYGEHILQAFNCLASGSVRAMVFRLMILYAYGGVYMNLDVEPVDPLQRWGFGKRSVITGNGFGCGLLSDDSERRKAIACPHTFGMIYREGHEILRTALFGVVEMLATRNTTHAREIAIAPYFKAFWDHKGGVMPKWEDNFGGHVKTGSILLKSKLLQDGTRAAGRKGTIDYLWQPGCFAKGR